MLSILQFSVKGVQFSAKRILADFPMGGTIAMTLYLDADGCPVVDIAIRVARECGIECVLISDTAHLFERDGARTITVSKGADSVDFALVNLVHPGDAAVTQDYGLAAMCLARRAIPLHHNGHIYTEDNIEALLMQRHTAKKARQAGHRTKGPKKRTPDQDEAFEAILRQVLTSRRADSNKGGL